MKKIYKIINALLAPFIFIRDLRVEKGLNELNEKERFTLFYQNSYWKPVIGGSLSGSGSSKQATEMIQSGLEKLISKYSIKSMLDVPCGDWFWMKDTNLQEINYIGGDIVSEIIESNSKNFLDEKINFLEIDIINDRLPKVDLVFVRDCFVHLEDDDIVKALKNIESSGSKYLVSTTYPGHKKNGRIVNKDRWRKLNLTKPPFSLETELELMPDMASSNIDQDKYMGVWQIANMFK